MARSMRRWCGCRGRRYAVGGRGISLRARVGREHCISRRGQDRTVEVYKLEECE